MVASFTSTVQTSGEGQVIDLTSRVLECVERSGIQDGTVSISSVSTMRYFAAES